MTRVRGMEKRGVRVQRRLMRGLVIGMLRMGIPMAVETLGFLEFMPLTGTETEGDQDGE